MNKDRKHRTVRDWLRRGISGVLCLALMLGLLPAMAQSVQAAQQSWAMPYAEQLVDWGVMRGDVSGNLNLGNAITRAEFVTMVNRAYGYERLGGNPFTDVYSGNWYAQDIDIAYNMGYFKGTSPTTASPLSPVTREQAAVLLARNLMLEETVGETLGFSDSRTLAEWSRGLIGAAAANGVITGYSDGSFRPTSNITRGEVAAMLVRAIGTPINEPGDHTLGTVYGNVTVSTSGVNLRNSVITGNLYLTGGVDLGDVLLENVSVMGQIIVSGAGESNSSQSSILLRNVEADEMIVDSISNQFVTIRAEGNTAIDTTRVRTNAYIDDSSLPGFGLSYIELDGESGSLLQLAGNVKEVVDKTPNSSLQVVQGTAQKITIDENAVGANVLVDTNTRVDELDLDVATGVTGDGDIKNLNVGAAGSSVEGLPDSIYIRPGITSDIAGTNMTSSVAAESSADPRLLAGYPKAQDVAPTTATAVFSTNKAGTVYWAISAVSDGSIKEDDLITPPVYGGKAVKSGNLKASASNTEYSAKLTGLTTDGSYYLSAILVDERGNRSPLKVTAFTTPDNTTPAFTTGYPVMSKNTTETAQVTAMTNKSCLLYYALLPSGSTAPKAAEFKANAITGNLGYGVVDMVKNVTQPVNVNNWKLEELTTYDLYLWLTDYDGAKSSAVKKVTFTTADETPPTITYVEQDLSKTTATAVGVTYTLDEPGTLYWVIYADDATNAFATAYGRDESDTERWDGESVEARAFVKAGLSSIKKGTSSASKAATEISFAISALNSKTTGTTSYMVYVVAEDKAGNLSERVIARNVRTLDTDPPTVTQEFTKVDIDEPDEPEVDTDIRLVFNESVQGNPQKDENFYDLYTKVVQAADEKEAEAARNVLSDALRAHITMHYIDATGSDVFAESEIVRHQSNTPDNWVVDYRYATVSMENGSMVITLPTTSNKTTENTTVGNAVVTPSALNLRSGGTYYFVLSGIYDQALTPNAMNKNVPVQLPKFRVVFAHVSVISSNSISIKQCDGSTLAEPVSIDFKFVVKPEAVEAVDDDMMWDMLIWVDRSMSYDLYSRPARPTGTADDGMDWVKEGSVSVDVYGLDDGFIYSSLRKDFQCKGQDLTFLQLNQMIQDHGDREYAMHITNLGSSYGDSDGMSVRVSIVAGSYTGLKNVTEGKTLSQLNTAMTRNGVATIGRPNPWTDSILDPYPPQFNDNYPVIETTDTTATLTVSLSPGGSVNYVAVPLTVAETDTGFDVTKAMAGQENLVTRYTSEVMPTAYALGKNWSTADGAVSTTGTVVTPKSGTPLLTEVPSQGPTADKNANGAITNDNRYYVSVPEAEQVAALAQAEDTGFYGTMRSGKVSTTGSGRTSSVTLKDLEPDTIYMLYMVTENASGYREAHAECYYFTTTVIQPPRLELSGSKNPTITAYVEEGVTDYMWYYVIPKSSVGAPFTTPFKDIADVDNMHADDAAKYSADMTALDALNTRCYRTTANGSEFVGTLFDLYVKKEYTTQFSDAIKANSGAGSSNNIIGSSGLTPIPVTSRGVDIKCGDMPGFEGGRDFVLVAMASRTTAGGNYAFAVYDPVNKEDYEAPVIVAATISNTTWGVDGNTGESATLTSAALELVFDEDLYNWTTYSGKTDAYPIDGCKSHSTNPALVTPSGSSTSIPVYAIGNAGGSTTFTINGSTGGSHSYPINSISFTITNLASSNPLGDSATFRYRIVDAKGNGSSRDSLIVVVRLMDIGTGGNHNWTPVVYINNVKQGDSVWTQGNWNYTAV